MSTLFSKMRAISRSIGQNKIIQIIVSEWSETQIPFLAGGMAFFTILSLIPFLAVVFSIARLTGRFNIDEITSFVLNYLTPRQADNFLTEINEALSRLSDEYFGLTGLALGFFILAGLLRRLDKVVQMIWKTETRSSMWRTVGVFLIEIIIIIPIVI